jgi:hypothetical protein
VKVRVEKGVRVNARNKAGLSPLDIASGKGGSRRPGSGPRDHGGTAEGTGRGMSLFPPLPYIRLRDIALSQPKSTLGDYSGGTGTGSIPARLHSTRFARSVRLDPFDSLPRRGTS